MTSWCLCRERFQLETPLGPGNSAPVEPARGKLLQSLFHEFSRGEQPGLSPPRPGGDGMSARGDLGTQPGDHEPAPNLFLSSVRAGAAAVTRECPGGTARCHLLLPRAQSRLPARRHPLGVSCPAASGAGCTGTAFPPQGDSGKAGIAPKGIPVGAGGGSGEPGRCRRARGRSPGTAAAAAAGVKSLLTTAESGPGLFPVLFSPLNATSFAGIVNCGH